MEIIAVILFVLFFVVGIGDKKKKGNSAAPKPGMNADARRNASANARGARVARPVKPASALPKDLNDLKAAMKSWVEDVGTEAVGAAKPAAQAAQGASMLDDAECAGGSMPHTHAEGHSTLADADCIGGSMEHTHTEGVSRADQARRMAAIDADCRGGEDILPEAIDAKALRRAVVMAEVLGKPRALRRYR